MGNTFKSPQTEQEWRDYYQLRWLVLREPWQQPQGSEQDALEDQAFHIMAVDASGHTIGTGRLHRLTQISAQIRYMAVHPQQQGKGIGRQLLQRLEQEAVNWGCQEIVLNARSGSLDFYLHQGYQIIGEAPLLFGSIAHKHMRKLLVQPA